MKPGTGVRTGIGMQAVWISSKKMIVPGLLLFIVPAPPRKISRRITGTGNGCNESKPCSSDRESFLASNFLPILAFGSLQRLPALLQDQYGPFTALQYQRITPASERVINQNMAKAATGTSV